jgi:transposase
VVTAVKVMLEQKSGTSGAEYRAEALSLAERIGAAAVDRELGLYATQIYQWGSKAVRKRSRA